MLYVWMGFLKPGVGPVPQSVQEETTGFLSQPLIKIHSAGQLLDQSGERAGMMMIFEHDSREAAEALVASSPYLRAGLYETGRLFEYLNEAG